MGNGTQRHNTMKTLPTFLARLTIASVLALAACAKLTSPDSFQESLESFKLFPKLITPLLSYFVPIVELLTALLILLKGKELVGATVSCILSLGFVTSLTWAVMTRSTQDCGCFGDWEMTKVSPELALLRALTILSLSALLLTKILADINRPKDKVNSNQV